MIYMVFSIYDEKAEVFNTPFFQRAEPEAIRAFADLAVDPNTLIGRHPADFSLYYIGEYNDHTSELGHQVPRFVMKATQCLTTRPGVDGAEQVDLEELTDA